jgi:hypothetical protein
MEQVDLTRIAPRLKVIGPKAARLLERFRRSVWKHDARDAHAGNSALPPGFRRVAHRNKPRGDVIREVRSENNAQLDYEYKTKQQVRTAYRKESVLVQQYRAWLERGGRTSVAYKCGGLQCDGFEKARRNLIEAKSSISREHIRMAVGQLLDYAHRMRRKFRRVYHAILLPERPYRDIVTWLKSVNVWVIWEKKGEFVDNAQGRFTRIS